MSIGRSWPRRAAGGRNHCPLTRLDPLLPIASVSFIWTVLIGSYRLRQLQNAVGPGAACVRCRFGSSPHTDQNTAESYPGGRRVLPKCPGDDLTNHYQGHANGEHRMHAVLNTEVARNRDEH